MIPRRGKPDTLTKLSHLDEVFQAQIPNYLLAGFEKLFNGWKIIQEFATSSKRLDRPRLCNLEIGFSVIVCMGFDTQLKVETPSYLEMPDLLHVRED